MYDTLKKYLSKEKVKNTNLLAEIPRYLTNVREVYCPNTDTMKTIGNCKNYRVNVSNNGVYLEGSACKYWFGDNLHTLDCLKTKEAIAKLSDELHLPINQANLLRIDLAENFSMNYEASYYYEFLGQASRYDRLEQNNGIYYRNSLKEMVFYDKRYEQKSKRMPIPEQFRLSNMLRYEFRFKKRLCKQFNLSEITASTLYNEKFYLDIINRWKAEYFKINKLKQYNLDSQTINNVKDFEKLIYLNGIKALGGEAAMFKMIERAKKKGEFKNKMQLKRCKDKLRSICNTTQRSLQSDANTELDKKVNDVCFI